MPSMPFIPFNNVFEVVLQGKLAGQNAFMTMAFQHNEAITFTILDDAAAIIDLWYHVSLAHLMSPQYSLPTFKLTDLTSETAPARTYNMTTPQEGTNTGATVPNNCAMVMSLYTALRGRSYRGRIFVPGLPAAGLINATTWNITEVSAIDDAFGALKNNMVTDGNIWVVCSRYHNNVRRTVGVATPMSNIVGKQPIGTQRRRVIGRGQ